MAGDSTSSRNRVSPARRGAKRGSKVFSGCWTCRDRRVKCDELRPSCRRCDGAGFQCQGYDIRLVWKGPLGTKGQPRSPSLIRPPSLSPSRSFSPASVILQDEKPRYAQRSNLVISQPASKPSALSRAEVSSIQTHLKDSRIRTPKSSSSTGGLFSVFRTTSFPASADAVDDTTPSKVLVSEELSSTLDEAFLHNFQRPIYQQDEQSDQVTAIGAGMTGCLSTFDHPLNRQLFGTSLHQHDSTIFQSILGDDYMADDALIGMSPAFHDYSPPSSLNGSEIEFLDRFRGVSHDLTNKEAEHDTSTVSASPLRVKRHVESPSSTTSLAEVPQRYLPSHLDLSNAPAEQSELIMHFITTLTRDMTPVYQIDKPQHSALLPVALAGLSSKAGEFDGEIAVCHGICSAAAFNLSRLKQKGHGDRLHQLGIEHRQLALSHLRRSMARKEQSRCTSIWAAILTLLIYAGVQGQAEEWRTHVKALRSLVVANLDICRHDMVAQVVLESCLCISILGNLDDDPIIQTMLDAVPSTPSYMETAHGVSKSLLELIRRINVLAPTIKPGVPRTKEADQLHLELLLHAPSSLSILDSQIPSSARLLLHYSNVYYFSALIYFERRIRRRSPMELQGFVERVLDHLEAVELEANATTGCIWTWPCLVTAAECTETTLQLRLLRWFQSKRRHGFANLDLACDIAKEVWRRRELCPDNPGEVLWQDVTTGADYDILPL
ncbi:hypothetical protein LTR84_003592 [Exophiala bonariae]|uniref:Zn(2)-C6 fungal-type domain-containing protein n=1 Tax=Exophiala bonariae TaxID=1690606 RepID=A0AAV9N7R5_9EURO|nr:hypothetical protein LTR84_003592 [Exophiala bonariae]